MNYWLATFEYITHDPYFWPSMSITSIVGVFIGAVVHNGDLRQARKTLVSLGFLVFLIIVVNVNRVLPQIGPETPPSHPFASVLTVLSVTLFYLIGMTLGILAVKKARGHIEIKQNKE
jgi:hypothetical protein